jgi:hypothetical protein
MADDEQFLVFLHCLNYHSLKYLYMSNPVTAVISNPAGEPAYWSPVQGSNSLAPTCVWVLLSTSTAGKSSGGCEGLNSQAIK